MRSEITWRSVASSKMPASATLRTLSAYASMSAPTTSSSAARRAIASMVSSRLVSQEMCDEVVKELLVTLLVLGDPADETVEHRLGDLRFEVAAVDRVCALVERHEHQPFDLAVGVGAVALHDVLDADVLIGGRIDLTGDDEIVAQRDRVQVLLGGPPAQPAAPLLLEDEAEDELAVVGGEVVLLDEQDLQRIGDVLGQRDLRRVPVLAAEEREVLALFEWARNRARTRCPRTPDAGSGSRRLPARARGSAH